MFLDLYSKYAAKYGEAVLQDMFGFADQAAFKKLIADTKKNLPKEMQAKFTEAAKEIKTVDGLAKLLNRMFTQHGNTLEYGYMVVDYGGKDSVWLRITPKTYKNVLKLGDKCVENHRSIDSVLGGVLQLIADGKLDVHLNEIIAKTLPVVILNPTALPTEESLNG
jgi:Cu/Ag efflux protein CusF